MLKRLGTDRSLAAFAGQFVPLKINSNGSPEWSKWSRQYKHEGKSIPILFVVRADGKMLYGRSGMLTGAALPRMLLSVLGQSGRRYTDAEIELLETVIPAAKEALKKGESANVALAFAKLKAMGKPGAFNSFATAAVEADELATKLIDDTKKKIHDAEEALTSGQANFTSLLYLAEVKDAYGAFAALPADASRALKKVKGNDELKVKLAQAEALQRARRYAMADSPTVRRKAVAAYERVVQRYPNTEAAELAAAERSKLADRKKPNGPSTNPVTAEKDPPSNKPAAGKASEYRQWSDKSGKFKVLAKLVTVHEGEIALQTKDGKKIDVPLERLSEKDRKFVLSQWDDQ